ncbi:MAG TPA: hypothetical protein VGM39_04270 [Kofleriaceae bacterium]
MKRALVLALLVACQGKARDAQGSGSAIGSGSVGSDAAKTDVPEAPDVGSGSAAATKPEEPDVPDPGKKIDQLGAIPAWQAVVDRYLYLARREQSGIVFGRVGAPVMQLAPPPPPPEVVPGKTPPRGPTKPEDLPLEPSGYAWLVDDTEGNGALAIRVLFDAKKPPPAAGDRIAVRGAWELDAKNRWYWKSAGVEAVPAAPASDLADAQPAAPDHAIATGPLPPGARTISVAKDGDLVYFQITGPLPVTEGDGWQVADAFGAPAVALLALPGERPAYGGQEMRGDDEKWHLKRQRTYVVRIGKIRKRGNINTGGKPAIITARTAPMELK